MSMLEVGQRLLVAGGTANAGRKAADVANELATEFRSIAELVPADRPELLSVVTQQADAADAFVASSGAARWGFLGRGGPDPARLDELRHAAKVVGDALTDAELPRHIGQSDAQVARQFRSFSGPSVRLFDSEAEAALRKASVAVARESVSAEAIARAQQARPGIRQAAAESMREIDSHMDRLRSNVGDSARGAPILENANQLAARAQKVVGDLDAPALYENPYAAVEVLEGHADRTLERLGSFATGFRELADRTTSFPT